LKNLIIIVLIFLVIISSLIFNLITANKKIDSYFEINSKIIHLLQKNNDLYQFSLTNIKFNNYDNINNDILIIKDSLNDILDTKKYPLIKNTTFYSKSLEINKLIFKEIELLEKLKSYNAVYNNSIRNIKILKSKTKDIHLYDEIYNKALTLNYEDNLNLEQLKNEIKQYKTENEIEKLFLSHANIIFEYFIKKQDIKRNVDELNLFDQLKLLHDIFENYMEDIIKDIKFSIIIFIILLIISIFLFTYYAYKVLKNKIELEKLKNALDISDNIIVITDINHYIKYVNYGFNQSSGYSEEEVIGKKPSILRSGFHDKEFYDKLNETIHSGKKWNGEFINKDKFGKITYEKSSITPIKNDKGEIIEFLAVKLDVTKEKEYQKVLAQQSKMVSMGELLENIAHQWRQPLSIISAISSGSIIQLDYNTLSKEELKNSFNKIFDTTQKLSNTIDDLKNFFQKDEEIVTFEVGSSVEKAINLFSIKTEFNHINIEFDKNINTLFIGKESEFIQTILNILNNSLDAFITNKIEKKVIKISTNQNSEKIQIKISDNAGGVDENILDKLFDLYFTTKHKSIGTGVGLYMAYQIVTQHFKGEMYVKNSTMLINEKEYKGLDILINIPI
jgi:PAS domain S-box-containing protein